MAEYEELSFIIPGYTPETMPLNRLIEYLQQMAVVLGDPENLHLVEIRESSVAPVLHAPRATALEARERASRVQRGDGTKRQVEAYNRIRRMVRRDAAGTQHAGRPALLKSPERILLEIPAAPDDSGVVEGLRQFTSIDGQLIRVGGAGDNAAIQLQELDGKIVSGFTARRQLAKELAQLLYEPVRLMGVGQWGRNEDGVWTLERMLVQGYERIEDEDPDITLARLRDLDVTWPADAWERLMSEREG
ncbi:MAG: hypothetical protein KDJ20_00665 [Hyphomicrobiales bacterium]|nr:hypothetical protein [Amphiplicatus sp.]MCC2102638.1 hypothetical protein [Hyphomicrobiales bacterium]MCC2109942.1 hypothetical protein [Hyphomicrobiales bacterium]